MVQRQQKIYAQVNKVSYDDMHAPFKRLLLSPPSKTEKFEPRLDKMSKSCAERKQDSLVLLRNYQDQYWKHFSTCQTGTKYNFDQEDISEDQSFDMTSDEWPERGER